MDAFMLAGEFQRCPVNAQDDMAERHRRSSSAQQGEMSQKKGDRAAVNLDHAVYRSRPRSGGDADEKYGQPDTRRGKRPHVGEDSLCGVPQFNPQACCTGIS